jgi:hypothetical protein
MKPQMVACALLHATQVRCILVIWCCGSENAPVLLHLGTEVSLVLKFCGDSSTAWVVLDRSEGCITAI